MNKLFLFAILATLLGSLVALEREQDFGSVDTSSPTPVEESTESVPVTTLKSLDGDEEDKDVAETPGQDAQCSRQICRIKCRLNGCFESECLDDGRCRCFCRRFVDPIDHFFRSILTSHLEPGLTVRMRPFSGFPSLDSSRRGESAFPDLRKFLEGATQDGLSAKVYFTLQQTCHEEEDCSAVCANCTATQCVDNFCQCTGCNREGVDSRSTNVLHTCRSARTCAEHCKGCVKTTCRYGVCECGQCQEIPPESEGTTEISKPSSTPVPEETEASTTAEIFSVRNNQTVPESADQRKCVPKRCNHSCWERQCTKWNCVEDRCECEGCPEEVAVIVKNGEPQKAEDKNKYEIIF